MFSGKDLLSRCHHLLEQMKGPFKSKTEEIQEKIHKEIEENKIHNQENCPIFTLGNENLVHIWSFLDPSSLGNVRLCCWKNKVLIDSCNSLWKTLVWRDWEYVGRYKRGKGSRKKNGKKCYKQIYIALYRSYIV